jgi:hypothetical protein
LQSPRHFHHSAGSIRVALAQATDHCAPWLCGNLSYFPSERVILTYHVRGSVGAARIHFSCRLHTTVIFN